MNVFPLPAGVSGLLPEKLHQTTPTAERLNSLNLPSRTSWKDLRKLDDIENLTYGTVVLEQGGQRLELAFHKHFPLLAPVQITWGIERPVALGFRRWGDEVALLEKDFKLLNPEWLALKPDPEIPEVQLLMAGLDDAEFAWLSYFRPRNVGEIIFNDWDKTGI